MGSPLETGAKGRALSVQDGIGSWARQDFVAFESEVRRGVGYANIPTLAAIPSPAPEQSARYHHLDAAG